MMIVSLMTTYQPTAIFGALSDPVRLAVVMQLCRGPASVSALRAPFPIAGPTFLRHLHVLEAAGLVGSQKVGRVRTCFVRREGLDWIETWVRSVRDDTERRLDRLEQFLESEEEPDHD